jgi:hypothetical protein
MYIACDTQQDAKYENNFYSLKYIKYPIHIRKNWKKSSIAMLQNACIHLVNKNVKYF